MKASAPLSHWLVPEVPLICSLTRTKPVAREPEKLSSNSVEPIGLGSEPYV